MDWLEVVPMGRQKQRGLQVPSVKAMWTCPKASLSVEETLSLLWVNLFTQQKT